MANMWLGLPYVFDLKGVVSNFVACVDINQYTAYHIASVFDNDVHRARQSYIAKLKDH